MGVASGGGWGAVWSMELALSYFCFSNRCGAVARVKQIKLQHEIELPAGS